jgi:ornithine cyclodeaminase/alanine dehydrogenase-like protein (mu-crystallin family)
MTARPFVYLSDDDVRELLDVRQATAIAEQTLLAHARDQVDWCEPRQIMLRPAGSDTVYKQKACALRDIGVAGMRVIGLNRTDEGIELALHNPSKYILLSDPATGLFFCIMEEHWSHAVRTGVCVSVAAKYLARPDARVIGMIGAGFMAKATLLALKEAELWDVAEVRVYSKRATSREAYAREMSASLGLKVVACDHPRAVCEAADLLVTASSAKELLVYDAWLRPGVFVYSMGEFQEIETPVYRSVDRLYVDDWEHCKLKVDIQGMLAEGSLTEDDVYADLGAVVAGLKDGRRAPEERLMLRSQGLVTQDIAIAYWLYQQAVERGMGQHLRVGHRSAASPIGV